SPSVVEFRYWRASASNNIVSRRAGSRLLSGSIERSVSIRLLACLSEVTYVVGNRRNDGDARTDSSVGGNDATNPSRKVGASQGAVAMPRTIGGKNGPGSGESSPKTSATPRVSPGCSCQIVVSSPSKTCAALTGSSPTTDPRSASLAGSGTTAASAPSP